MVAIVFLDGCFRYYFNRAVSYDAKKPGFGNELNPPPSHGPHHYHFRLLALSVDRIEVRKSPSCDEVQREARRHVIVEATLVGTTLANFQLRAFPSTAKRKIRAILARANRAEKTGHATSHLHPDVPIKRLLRFADTICPARPTVKTAA